MAQPPRRGCDSCHPAGKRVAADIVQPHGDTLDEERMPALSVIGQIALHLTDADRADGGTAVIAASVRMAYGDPLAARH